MAIPADYTERVYAGVLGKIIGVYLGRPFEGWDYDRITRELGDIEYYVHEKLGCPLVVTDDDISGTFTFLRALEDYGASRELTAKQLGETWLNYLIEDRTVIWWGGSGISTEHTAYLNLKSGIPAPQSGSAGRNGQVVAEQIGAQIFVDGWGLVSPAQPELAVELASKAARVSHDGEAVYAARVVAAIEAQAFVESSIERLLDIAVSFIPSGSVIYRLIEDLREWRTKLSDWRAARRVVEERYGYHLYGGGCHVVPNHALIILALLYGEGDFQQSLKIVNTCGWDTDCNSGNVGCILGIRDGLAAINGEPDWRGPVADRMYLSTADGGRCVTDAAREAIYVAGLGRALSGEPESSYKGGARWSFELPGSLHGFRLEAPAAAAATIENTPGYSVRGSRSLAVTWQRLSQDSLLRAGSSTFIPPNDLAVAGYDLLASPTLYAGQTITASLCASEENEGEVICSLYLRRYREDASQEIQTSHTRILSPGERAELQWVAPPCEGRPIAETGIQIASQRDCAGAIYLDFLTWQGTPHTALSAGSDASPCRRAWVDGLAHFGAHDGVFELRQPAGTGIIMQGTREWRDYRAEATIIPSMARETGLAIRVQGMRRYYALCFAPDGRLRLVKRVADTEILAECVYDWKPNTPYRLYFEAAGTKLSAWALELPAGENGAIYVHTLPEVQRLDGPLLAAQDGALCGGAIGLICADGAMQAASVAICGL
ncbi:MAG TPA: ADP-ribosylglycohydrolase family protein [Chthonomonadales bacterium]|nr:ADP-ribosylglycohydrolase family protein [Chthonomonadales bacterium]